MKPLESVACRRPPFWLWVRSCSPRAPSPQVGLALAEALFVQTNNPGANRIIVYDRAWDGTLTVSPATLPAQRRHGRPVRPQTRWASQGALVSAEHGRVLLAVNGRQQLDLTLPGAR